MLRHTFKITLGNGAKGEITVDMPEGTSDEFWADRANDVNGLAMTSWTIAAQSGARNCATIEEAQAYCDAYKHGVRATRVTKQVVINATELKLTKAQREGLEAAGAKVI